MMGILGFRVKPPVENSWNSCGQHYRYPDKKKKILLYNYLGAKSKLCVSYWLPRFKNKFPSYFRVLYMYVIEALKNIKKKMKVTIALDWIFVSSPP